MELGLVPVGSALLGVFSTALAAARGSYGWSIAALTALGLSGGLFIVPLNAFLQHRSEAGERRGGHDVLAAGQENPDAAWYYPEPLPAAANIKGFVAFWKGVKVEA